VERHYIVPYLRRKDLDQSAIMAMFG